LIIIIEKYRSIRYPIYETQTIMKLPLSALRSNSIVVMTACSQHVCYSWPR